MALPVNAKLTARYDRALLGGVTVIEGEGRHVRQGDGTNQLYRPLRPGKPENDALLLIHYYTWNNRGVPYMSVWLAVAR